MRRFSLILTVLIVAALAATSAGAATSSATAPTPQQVHKAVAQAKSSGEVWATINICGTTGNTRAVGIRGQIPALGFTTDMYMTFALYSVTPTGARELVPGTRKTFLLARGSTRIYQGGVTFHLPPPATFIGRVLFQWKLQGRALGHAVRWTTANHKHVDHASPPGHSAAVCTLQ